MRDNYGLLTMIAAAFLFSCAASPPASKWIENPPQAPHGANYAFVIGEAVGKSDEDAIKKAEEEAHKKAATARGMDLRNTAGVRYVIRCEHLIKENAYNYKAYILLKYQIDFNGKKDFNDPDNIKCEAVGGNKTNENSKYDSEIRNKRGVLYTKINSLKTVAQNIELEESPKEKSKDWAKAKILYDEINEIRIELRNLNAAEGMDSIIRATRQTFNDMKNSYIAYCKTAKLHWKSEQENDYSSMAFSILSKNLKMEKSACQDNGVSLVHKNAEPDCSSYRGVYNCSYKPSLSLISCNGTEYLLLEEDTIERAHQKQELALEKVKEAFKKADFWGKWEREIKEWSPKCE